MRLRCLLAQRAPRVGVRSASVASRGQRWLWGQRGERGALRSHLRGTADLSQPRNAGNKQGTFGREAAGRLPVAAGLEPAPPSPES